MLWQGQRRHKAQHTCVVVGVKALPEESGKAELQPSNCAVVPVALPVPGDQWVKAIKYTP